VLARNCNRLLLVDNDSDVVAFNRVNIALLKIAQNREHYLSLRLSGNFSDWQRAAVEAGYTPADLPDLNEHNWAIWNEDVRSTGNRNWTRFHRDPTKPAKDPQYFKGANYLWEDALFTRISRLAKNNRIEAHKANLGDKKVINAIVKNISSSGNSMSVVDLSNAWHPQYLSHKTLVQLLNILVKSQNPNAILLLTNYADASTKAKYGEAGPSVWKYYGYRFSTLENSVGVKLFVDILRELHEGLHGHPSCGEVVQILNARRR
jgi:hypothetical protein